MLYRSQCTFRALQSLKFHAVYPVPVPWLSVTKKDMTLTRKSRIEHNDNISIFAECKTVLTAERKAPVTRLYASESGFS